MIFEILLIMILLGFPQRSLSVSPHSFTRFLLILTAISSLCQSCQNIQWSSSCSVKLYPSTTIHLNQLPWFTVVSLFLINKFHVITWQSLLRKISDTSQCEVLVDRLLLINDTSYLDLDYPLGNIGLMCIFSMIFFGKFLK